MHGRRKLIVSESETNPQGPVELLPETESNTVKLLTRSEEYVLLTVWKLQDEAYSLALMRQLAKTSGQKWSLGSIYTPLERLVKRGLLTSYQTEATAERGGRPKRIYQLTAMGRKQLLHTRKVDNAMWSGITNLALAGAGS